MRRILFIFFRLWGFHVIARLKWNARHKSYEENFEYLQKVCQKGIKVGRVNAEYHGMENVPKEGGFVYFPNHQGMFDVMMFLASSPRPLSFVMKKELANLPLLKQVRISSRSLYIDREDIRQSMQVIMQMTEAVKDGKGFLIFAEGTRSKKKNAMNDMKGGSFKSAVKAQAPIVPCALLGAYEPFDGGHIRRVNVALYYLEPLYYEDYKDMKTIEIAAEVKRRIEAKIVEVTNVDTRYEKPIDNQ